MDEAELRIEEVVIEDALLAGLGDEARPLFVGNEGEGVAGFLGAKDADESGFDTLLADQLLGPCFFLEETGAIQIGSAGLASESLGMFDQSLEHKGATSLMKWLRRTLRINRRSVRVR